LLGIKPMGITDGLAVPMTEVFTRTFKPWDFTAIVPEVLRTTALPLPVWTAANSLPLTERVRAFAKPKHDAVYWARVMGGQFFEVEDKLDEPRFNRALWTGLKGEAVPYPSVRHGRDLSQNRAQMLQGLTLSAKD
jgi:hypothetical protein